MTAILYPVAETAEAALHAPRGFAVRAREAQAMAGMEVAFATETVGPAFSTREAALEAYGGGVEEARWRELTPVSPASGQPAGGRPVGDRRAVQPVYRDGRRWPAPTQTQAMLWRLSVSYWRIGVAPMTASDVAAPMEDAARRLRRGAGGRGLAAPALNALARQPLRPVKPQQPLDIGLFEVRPPEAPDTLIPDE